MRSRPFRSDLAPGAVIIGLLALVLLAELPSYPRIYIILNNAAHAPVFALVSFAVFRLIRRTGSMSLVASVACAFVVTMGLGVAVELVQGLIGRDASWSDVGSDALGAACALGLLLGMDQTQGTASRGAALSIVLLALVLALHPVATALAAYRLRSSSFPVIVQFGSPLDLYFLQPQGASAERVPLPARWARPGDAPSLRLNVLHEKWPGIAVAEPEPDWRGYRALLLDVTNPAAVQLQMVLRVHDIQHDHRLEDRFNRRISVAAESRTRITIPLAEIEAGPTDRRIDLRRITGLVLFVSDLSARPGTQLYVTRIWLE